MKLSEIREILDARGIQLTKSLGQNFLHDRHQLERIADGAALGSADQVLEIGPGLGPLTELLLDRAGHVLAIEKDARLAAVLEERLAGRPNLDVLRADALEVVRNRERDWSEWKLVANLPYAVASPLLVELAQNPHRPERMVVTLQLEVVRRLVARSGDDDYGLLTLLIQLRYEPAGFFKVPRGCFFPEPDVDSACVTLLRRTKPLLDEPLHAVFERIVKRSFSQRRKMMFKLLKQDWPEPALKGAFHELTLPSDIRAERLDLVQFVALTKLLVKDE